MKYLAYGMNTNLNGMQRRCPTAQVLGPATLSNYRLRFRLHADIEPKIGSEVVGVLWEISEDDLTALDMLEGYPTYYTRLTVPVIHDDKTVDAVVYMMTDQTYEEDPHLEYLDCCIQGYTDNGISIDQLEEAYNSALHETVIKNNRQYVVENNSVW
jgi:gamma-glutamylcyclotransferase (GGCT)/AIG2-like uncharacterized protein YtfP